ncbi:MAG: acylphosphatase [Chloroflexota bacterium]
MSISSNETVRVHVWVEGRVQGVGFRAFVQREALRIGVLGWVRNVGYDTVEAVAEGEKDKASRFIQVMVRGPLGSRVDDWREEWETVTGEFTGFRVRASA